MFNYSIKIKIFLIGLLIISIVVLIFLISINKSRGRDLYRVSQAKVLATSLERYFDKNYAYPELVQTNITAIKIVTEKGVNQVGDYLYFQGPAKLLEEGTLVSSPSRYVIEFTLENSWDLWGISSSAGGTCRISNYLQMVCRSQDS
ncbi:MAG: hypothetical protein A2406_01210 [Candidatus Komeilibacteria bacterium RIFOXYC1_FULL_37_11]|uniref:Uncharacterized protein n=1 Tax=Candidatus Komeilibacteria bacterium RIFOXYC1_FULL_37_11 TaxID=1798555 RepID=A0A1G2BW69_9BACT|nr:MAG: hypothetical protein A2406_01210 [Candidatus Komeilibacteria bacterium RIFOXYC1_FULL_37_11]OGY95764.1 MAG: hypothetical protein A2611_03235 [Candidatus Komeilibacteria bacterium RIFOXYD1_FULL_37_29]